MAYPPLWPHPGAEDPQRLGAPPPASPPAAPAPHACMHTVVSRAAIAGGFNPALNHPCRPTFARACRPRINFCCGCGAARGTGGEKCAGRASAKREPAPSQTTASNIAKRAAAPGRVDAAAAKPGFQLMGAPATTVKRAPALSRLHALPSGAGAATLAAHRQAATAPTTIAPTRLRCHAPTRSRWTTPASLIVGPCRG